MSQLSKILLYVLAPAAIFMMFLSLLLAYALRGLANLIDYHYWLDMEDTR